MAEITAGMVKELRDNDRARHDGMQEGAGRSRRRHGQGRGAAARQERRQGVQGGRPRRRRRRGRRVHVAPTASSARWSRSTAKPTSSPRTRISWRSRAALARTRRRAQTRPTSRRLSRCRLDGDAGRGRARKALVQKIGENIRSAASRASQAKGKLAQLPARRTKIGVLVDVDGGDDALGKDLAMHIAASKPVALSRTRCRPS